MGDKTNFICEVSKMHPQEDRQAIKITFAESRLSSLSSDYSECEQNESSGLVSRDSLVEIVIQQPTSAQTETELQGWFGLGLLWVMWFALIVSLSVLFGWIYSEYYPARWD